MIDISQELPNRIRLRGAKLFETLIGERIKYVLEHKEKGYRAFLYVNTNFRDRDSCLKDLFNNYYYEMKIGTIAGNG